VAGVAVFAMRYARNAPGVQATAPAPASTSTARLGSSRTLAETTGKTLEGLASALRESSGAALQIALGTRQQTEGVQGMVAAVGEIATNGSAGPPHSAAAHGVCAMDSHAASPATRKVRTNPNALPRPAGLPCASLERGCAAPGQGCRSDRSAQVSDARTPPRACVLQQRQALHTLDWDSSDI